MSGTVATRSNVHLPVRQEPRFTRVGRQQGEVDQVALKDLVAGCRRAETRGRVFPCCGSNALAVVLAISHVDIVCGCNTM